MNGHDAEFPQEAKWLNLHQKNVQRVTPNAPSGEFKGTECTFSDVFPWMIS